MKSYNDIVKKHSPKEIAESIVFPDTRNKQERAAVLDAFQKFRKKLSQNQSEESRVIAQLLQLRFVIEDYIKDESFNDEYYFGYFLREYIGRLEMKNKDFAQDIDIDPTELSQVLNKHRKPTEKLILRLEIHSNKNFPAVMWFRLLEKERIYELSVNKSIIDNERKHVKHRLSFSF